MSDNSISGTRVPKGPGIRRLIIPADAQERSENTQGGARERGCGGPRVSKDETLEKQAGYLGSNACKCSYQSD